MTDGCATIMTPDGLAQDGHALARGLANLSLSTQRALTRILAQHGSTAAQARILSVIRHRHAIRSTDLASTLGLAPRSITEAIDGLERLGLVERIPDKKDRRAKILSLTARGATAADAVDTARRTFEHALFDCLGDRERGQLATILSKLAGELDRLRGEGEGTTQGYR